jgi:hypothetical protein
MVRSGIRRFRNDARDIAGDLCVKRCSIRCNLRHSQAKLGMMREALAKLDRQANERAILSTEKAS